MNKATLFISIMFASLIFPNAGYSSEAPPNMQILIREIRPRPTHPRKPERIVINCFYDDVTETLRFHFLEDIGEATIEITNTTTGESFFEICSSTPNSCDVSLSGEQGAYMIQIEDANGCYYTGSFIIE